MNCTINRLSKSIKEVRIMARKNKQEDIFDIMFDDLTFDAQERLKIFLGIKSAKDANYDVIPIAVIPRPEE